MTTEYQKISSLYRFDEKTRSYTTEYSNPEIEALADAPIWNFTEKIDGTNIRVIWDGFRVKFAGRTDNAQIPPKLLDYLYSQFGGPDNEKLFEQKFDKDGGPITTEVVLYGEGFGGKIQKGGRYSSIEDFIIFDVKIGGLFLSRENVVDIAKYFGQVTVPLVLENATLGKAIDLVTTGHYSQWQNDPNKHYYAEGLVGVTNIGLRDRRGERIAVKVKTRDLLK
jgi:hypothetical protein